ncbi:hypothetical protein Lesp02_74870 [Lentzea sp. NBRC 105346]|uniref:AfsR/SARP family transcriptional regulator n=1 Tax=Lentzea sp. NBRC 105346 TaxID=3032205 RepID=UPI00249FAF79|nr:bacterial transcriptional activator domain-containing protein [Lentzea sp. NBRC 105346]GLZ35300.1 hypothetical protein Lesp02_74870 [Lentzea sp. NBRC 105346]
MGDKRGNVRLVGAVALNGVEVSGREARTLLGLLGAAGGPVGIDAIGDELRTDVARVVRRLRAEFGPDVIAGGRRGYRLGDGIEVDLHRAAYLVGQAETALGNGFPHAGSRAVEQVLELIGGRPVLAEHPRAEWAERARARQAELLRRAWHTGASCALQERDPARARTLAEAAIVADPFDERAYGILTHACIAAGEPAGALLAHECLHARLVAELDTLRRVAIPA